MINSNLRERFVYNTINSNSSDTFQIQKQSNYLYTCFNCDNGEPSGWWVTYIICVSVNTISSQKLGGNINESFSIVGNNLVVTHDYPWHICSLTKL